MMDERVKQEGFLRVKENEERRLIVRLEGLRDSLRDRLDPLKDAGSLVGGQIADMALEFSSTQAELTKVRAEIRKAEELLGYR